MATRTEVAEFLNEFKVAIDLGLCHWKGQPKTEQGLIDLNLMRNQALKIICKLTVENYCSGPSPDDTDASKVVWIFGYDLQGVEVYIKLRLDESPRNKGQKRGLIWSFHPAEHSMKYPLKGGSP